MQENVDIKYFVTSEQDISWGMTVSTVGHQRIMPNASYPSSNHPLHYLFSTHQGRILQEYQLVYILEGEGVFVSKHKKQTRLKEGHFFLLFPGEWHNFKPDKEKGWYEYWIGFNGEEMDRHVRAGFFSPKEPIFNVGVKAEVTSMYKFAVETAQKQNTGYQQLLAGIVGFLLGYVYSGNKLSSFEDLKVTNQIDKAKWIMNENFYQNIAPESIAEKVGMSYSLFRRLFKQYTNLAPVQYLNELKIQKSKDLLTNTSMSSQEIAYQTGFEAPYYFCIVFKKRTGMSPLEYRKITQKSGE
jgi:AraC-like DNA-binding protein